MERAPGAGPGAAEGMAVALAAALASELALAAPLEGSWVGVPAARGRLEPVDDISRGGRCLSRERATDEDALDGFGHVEPGAAERGVQRHDAVLDQPQHQTRGLMAGQIVEDQQQTQGRQAFGQSEPDGEAVLPARPGRTVLRLRL